MTDSKLKLSRRGVLSGGTAAAAGLALGTSIAKARETARKVIFVAHEEIPFFAPVKAGFADFGKLRGWDTQFISQGSPPNIADVVRLQSDAINAKPDGLAFTRINDSAFDDNIQKAKELGIPLILFNVASDNYEKLGVAFVGQDFIPAGQVNGYQAALHAKRLGRTDGVILIDIPTPGNSAIEERGEGTRMGVEAYNEENGTNFTWEKFTTANTQVEALSRMDAKMRSLGDQVAGFTSTISGHWFMALWMEDNQKVDAFSNGGFDLIPGVLDAIEAGTSHWTIGQNPYAQGYVTSALLDMQMEAGYPAFSYDTGAEVVDASNVRAVIERENRFK